MYDTVETMQQTHKKQLTFLIALIVLLFISAVLLAKPINLATADLGRHIINGQIFIQEGGIPQGNVYSYTHPDFPFINHHWGSGVLLYLTHAAFGFEGLSYLYLALMLTAVALAFIIATNASSPLIAAVLSLPMIPLIATRGEVRPEAFSYLLVALFLYLLWRYRAGAAPAKSLVIIPFLMVLWVNLHLFFIMGIGIIGAFFIDALIRNKPYNQRAPLFAVLLSSIVATFVNPAGIAGALLPFTIGKNYGYRVFENQSVRFIEQFTGDYPPGLYFKIALGVLIASWVIVIWKRAWKGAPAKAIISIAFGALAWMTIRNLAIFGIIALPIAASNFSPLLRTPRMQWLKKTIIMLPLIIVIGVSLFFLNPDYFTQRSPGVGLIPKIENAATFIKQTNLQGPIFNNYDIGGYLIYALYPQKVVFVDNRPEAYPASFFQDVYIPMQQDNEIWVQQMKQYEFNAIIFYRHDQTEWGQALLINRYQDPAWAPIYVDGATIIFARRGGANQILIDKFELPKSMFRIRTQL